jgi:zinc/manganese transport system substrate-binding protein
MREADLLVTNGAGFEAGLDDTIDSVEADGTPVFAAVDHVPTIRAGRDAGQGEEDGGHDDTDEGVDPHVFTDPARMATMAAALSEELADEVPALRTPRARDRAAAYVAELEALDREVAETLAVVPVEHRKLVTNHDVFAYFAERYGFEVVGVVIPSVTTQAAASAGQIDDLAALVAAEGIPAVFADTSSPADLADALVAEAGVEVRVVELYSESLGEEGSGADTYAGMVRTNATRIAEALAPDGAATGPR